MPAVRQRRTAALASSRGGSIMPTRPSKVAPPSTSRNVKSCCSPPVVLKAKANTRRPFSARSSIARRLFVVFCGVFLLWLCCCLFFFFFCLGVFFFFFFFF